MAKKGAFSIRTTIDGARLARHSQAAIDGAMEKIAVQMLDWMASGSPRVNIAPPIRFGVLSASGSVFYGPKLIATSENIPHEGASEANRSHSGGKGALTFGFNTAYATKMHERGDLNPGPYSTASGNRRPGNQWVTAHLKGDAADFAAGVAAFLRGKF